MAQLKSTSINGNLTINGNLIANGDINIGSSNNYIGFNTGGFIKCWDSQHLVFRCGGETSYQLNLGVVDHCWALYPDTCGYVGLGSPNRYFSHLLVRDNPVVVSDERKKNILGSIDEKYFYFFDKTEPIKYTLKDEANDKIRLGLSAQSVEKALLSSGISLNEYSGLKHYIDKNSDSYFLDYNSYFMIAAAQTKKNKEKIKELEERIEKLESK